MPSIMQRIGTPNERHNKDAKYRAQLENVDPTLTKYNAVLRERSVESLYEEYLQPAFDAFNARQKRKDRRMDVKWGVSSALEWQRAMDEKARASKNEIDQKGRPPVREITWQIGNPSQGYGCAGQTDEHRELVKQMLWECQLEAERRYPNLVWGDAVFHADEVTQDANDEEHGSLHLQCQFVPLCFKNKQGPDVQVAMERCLQEMGFETFEAWKHDLDSIMEDVLHRHGLERTVMNNKEKHQESTEFHRQQRIIRQTRDLEAQQAALANKVIDQQALYDRNDAIIQDQQEALGLIKSVEDYQDEALDLLDTIDTTEEYVTHELPAAAKFFKASAAASFIRRTEALLDKLREYIEVGIQKLRIYERTHEVKEPLSEPVQRRAKSLGETIAGAFAKFHEEPGQKGNRSQSKEK